MTKIHRNGQTKIGTMTKIPGHPFVRTGGPGCTQLCLSRKDNHLPSSRTEWVQKQYRKCLPATESAKAKQLLYGLTLTSSRGPCPG
jgi:hypothetical protein